MIRLTRSSQRSRTDAAQTNGRDQPTTDAPVASLTGELLTGWLLLILAGGASHGYDMARRLEANHVTVDPSYLYRTLRKLERDGCVESGWTESTIGPRRRLYRLTRPGETELLNTAQSITTGRDLHEAFLRAHREILEQSRRSLATSSA